MDHARNPFEPGAGAPPPYLAGRDPLRARVRVAFERVRGGRSAKSVVLIGLRGVGKTVLLDALLRDAKAEGVATIRVEAPERRSLPAILAPQLRQALVKLSAVERAREVATRALRGLAGFAGAMKVKFGDVEVGLDYEPEPGLADNGDLEHDLQALLEVVGEAAQAADTAMAMFVDEMQYVEEEQLAALIVALHRTAQGKLPVLLFGAGLPQLPGRMGSAKSYAERLFEFADVGPLSDEDARHALRQPALDEGADFEDAALDRIVAETQGYPYFIQEWGKHSWDLAEGPVITAADVTRASAAAMAALDESFFRVRFDRLTPFEKIYLRAMAELGPGPHPSGEIAEVLGRNVRQVGTIRSRLIEKGMAWSPSYGDAAFTVPLFDVFMRRTMPGDGWKESG